MLHSFPQCFQALFDIVGAYMQHGRNMADNSKLIKQLALNYGRDQLQDFGLKTDVQQELINGYCELRKEMTADKMREVIVPAAAEYFRVSQKTVYNARRAVREKREAEEAHTKAVKDQLAATKRKTLQP